MLPIKLFAPLIQAKKFGRDLEEEPSMVCLQKVDANHEQSSGRPVPQ